MNPSSELSHILWRFVVGINFEFEDTDSTAITEDVSVPIPASWRCAPRSEIIPFGIFGVEHDSKDWMKRKLPPAGNLGSNPWRALACAHAQGDITPRGDGFGRRHTRRPSFEAVYPVSLWFQYLAHTTRRAALR